MADQVEYPKELVKLCDYLQSSKSKLTNKNGFFNKQRVSYFKGKHGVNALCRSKMSSTALEGDSMSREVGNLEFQKLLGAKMIIRVTVEDKNLAVDKNQSFDDQQHYVFLYAGSQTWNRLMGFGVLLVIFLAMLYPVWPPFMRQGAYYVSMLMMGFLGFVMALGVIRAILWLILILVLGQGGWLFPNLFADVGILESFMPLWRSFLIN